MAQWTEAQRAQVRQYLGFAAIFLQADPRLENALTAVLATSDGGTRPDSSTQLAIVGWITQIQSIEAQLSTLWTQAQVEQAGKVRLNAYRGMIHLRSDAYRFAGYIADALGTRPKRNVFIYAPTAKSGTTGDTFENYYMGAAGRRW